MACIQVPDTGMLLDCSPMATRSLSDQVFAVNLDSSAIEEMILCVRDGGDIELSLGNSPSLSYGKKTQPVHSTPENQLFDLFQAQSAQTVRRASKFPNATEAIPEPVTKKKAPSKAKTAMAAVDKPSRPTPAKTKASTKATTSTPAAKSTTAASKLLAVAGKTVLGTASSAPRSLPTSPALVGISSPSLNATLTPSQLAVSRAKEQRFTIVHELAACERTEDYLRSKWTGDKELFKGTLEKSADLQESTKTWCLRKTMWKELDVYNYKYESQEDRQSAIENAIKKYDQMRLGTSDPEWQRLLPKEERGKGKCLSKLQANIAKGPTLPARKREGSHDSPVSTDEPKSQPMSRSTSSQSKTLNSLLGGSKKTAKTTASKAANKVTKPTPKPRKTTAPVKVVGRAGAKDKGRVLSEAIITNSDDDGSEDEPLSRAKARHVPAPSRPAAPSKVAAAPSKVAAAPKPKPLPRQKPQSTSTSAIGKRRREEDDSSSSSGAPMSKKTKASVKPEPSTKSEREASNIIRAPVKKVASTSSAPTSKKQPRSSESTSQSQSRRTDTSSSSSAPSKATKTTSPTKSSPLASSPPTNASDMDAEGETPPPPPQSRRYTHSRGPSTASMPANKRKINHDDDDERRKRPRGIDDIVRMADNFKSTYTKYETLHHELENMDYPPKDKVANLVQMREKLVEMKKKINQGVDGVSA